MPWQNQAIPAVHALAAGDASGARPKTGAGEWQDCSITMSEVPEMRKTMKTATCGAGAGIRIATGAGAHVTVCAGNAVTVTAVTLVLPLPRYRGISLHAHIDRGRQSRKTGLIVVRATCPPASTHPVQARSAGERRPDARTINKRAPKNAYYDAIFSLPDKYGQTSVAD